MQKILIAYGRTDTVSAPVEKIFFKHLGSNFCSKLDDLHLWQVTQGWPKCCRETSCKQTQGELEYHTNMLAMFKKLMKCVVGAQNCKKGTGYRCHLHWDSKSCKQRDPVKMRYICFGLFLARIPDSMMLKTRIVQTNNSCDFWEIQKKTRLKKNRLTTA